MFIDVIAKVSSLCQLLNIIFLVQTARKFSNSFYSHLRCFDLTLKILYFYENRVFFSNNFKLYALVVICAEILGLI